jgi:putative ABC transport system permease protein
MSTLIQDLRYGLRMLAKNPGFTAVAVLTLALGIGANAAVFTLTYAVILKRLPVPDPEQLVRYTFRNGNQDLGLSGPLYDALSNQESAVTGLLAWSAAKLAVQENGEVKSVDGAMMTGNGSRVLELRPVLGHPFSDKDDVTGGGPNGYQALIGYDYWKDHFQGARSVLGQSLTINGRAVTIIGVLPRGFEGLIAGNRTDILLPLAFEEILNAPDSSRHRAGYFWLTVMGRLKPRQSLQVATADLRATESTVREEADPKHIFLKGFFAPFKLGVESGSSGRSFLRVAFEGPLLVLEIMVGLLLLLCCANTALLMLARVSSRHQEFAVRVALGAPRARLFRLILSEVAMLAACGLGAGIMVGWWAAQSLVAMLASIGEPPPINVTPRAMILAFTVGIAVFSALAASVWPALRASRAAPQPGLKRTQRSPAFSHLGGWFVPVQVALSMVLLAVASLLGGTFLHLLLEESGFHAAGVVLADVDLSGAKPTPAQAAQDARQILEEVEHAPGVESATLMSMAPLANGWAAGHYFSVDQQGGVHSDMQTWPEDVSVSYFATLGTPIIEGRGFSRRDLGGQPVCILSASAARYFFADEDPVGKYIYSGGDNPSLDGKTKPDPRNTCAVIGVAGDARFRSLREAPPRMVYELFGSDGPGAMFSLAVRSRSSAQAVSAIRSAMRRGAPGAAEPTTFTFNELVEQHLRSERMLTALSSSFAGVALLLTALGLYGLLARGVAMRTREIGVRLALGARPQDMLALVIRQGLKLVLIGAAAGLPVSLAGPRMLRSLLFGVRPTDPLLLVGIVAVLLAVAFPACYIPARRATKVDPMVALRYE